MIEDALQNSTFTSASPGFTNRIKQVNFTLTSSGDLAVGLDETLPTSTVGAELQDSKETVDRYKDSAVDDVSRFTTEQAGNLRSFVANPFLFVTVTFSRALSKSGPAILLLAIGKLVEDIITQLFAPGRPWDVRFREMAQNEILKFTAAREQAEIRAGFRQIIVTSIGGLRGDAAQGQIGGNFYNRNAIPSNRLDPTATTIITSNASAKGLGSSLTKGQGRFGGGPGN